MVKPNSSQHFFAERKRTRRAWGNEMGPGMRIDIFAAGACVEVVMILPSPRSSQLNTKTSSI
jgi:hypothetical protein